MYTRCSTPSAPRPTRRARAFPLIAQEPERMPDGFVSGPEIPLGDVAKRRFFGEE